MSSWEKDFKGYSQENSKEKEDLENAKPEELKIGNILSESITNISKKPELVQKFLNNV